MKESSSEIIEMVRAHCAEVYQRGYDAGRSYTDKLYASERYKAELTAKGYQRGLEDAWECAKKAWSMSETDFHKIFNTEWEFEDMLDNLSATEVVRKIKDYEKRQTEKSCENCFFYGHCKYYGKTLTWLLGDNNEQTGEKVCKSWKPNK